MLPRPSPTSTASSPSSSRARAFSASPKLGPGLLLFIGLLTSFTGGRTGRCCNDCHKPKQACPRGGEEVFRLAPTFKPLSLAIHSASRLAASLIAPRPKASAGAKLDEASNLFEAPKRPAGRRGGRGKVQDDEENVLRSPTRPTVPGPGPRSPKLRKDPELAKRLIKELLCVSVEANRTCTICGKKFTGPQGLSSLSRHVRTHAGWRPHQCPVCNRTFHQHDNLAQHLRIHSGEKPFRCKVCNRSFTQIGHLRIHLRIHQGFKPFVCGLCGSSFHHKVSMERHVYRHKGGAPFNCSLCFKSFYQKSNFQTHMRQLHYGIPLYQCPICDKRFQSTVQLTQHLAKHVVKTFRCGICRKVYEQRPQIANHILKEHPGYFIAAACDKCNRSFRKPHYLIRHQRQHSNRVLTCSLCKRVFLYRMHLVRHLESIHRENALLRLLTTSERPDFENLSKSVYSLRHNLERYPNLSQTLRSLISNPPATWEKSSVLPGSPDKVGPYLMAFVDEEPFEELDIASVTVNITQRGPDQPLSQSQGTYTRVSAVLPDDATEAFEDRESCTESENADSSSDNTSIAGATMSGRNKTVRLSSIEDFIEPIHAIPLSNVPGGASESALEDGLKPRLLEVTRLYREQAIQIANEVALQEMTGAIPNIKSNSNEREMKEALGRVWHKPKRGRPEKSELEFAVRHRYNKAGNPYARFMVPNSETPRGLNTELYSQLLGHKQERK